MVYELCRQYWFKFWAGWIEFIIKICCITVLRNSAKFKISYIYGMWYHGFRRNWHAVFVDALAVNGKEKWQCSKLLLCVQVFNKISRNIAANQYYRFYSIYICLATFDCIMKEKLFFSSFFQTVCQVFSDLSVGYGVVRKLYYLANTRNMS